MSMTTTQTIKRGPSLTDQQERDTNYEPTTMSRKRFERFHRANSRRLKSWGLCVGKDCAIRACCNINRYGEGYMILVPTDVTPEGFDIWEWVPKVVKPPVN